MATVVQDSLEAIDPETGKTQVELVVEAAIEEAKHGTVPAIKELLDRYIGKPKDTLAVEGSQTIELVTRVIRRPNPA